jgi:hypothetical protein
MAGLKQRFEEWRAGRRTKHVEDRKRVVTDPRPGLNDAKRDEQTKLQERFPSGGAGG